MIRRLEWSDSCIAFSRKVGQALGTAYQAGRAAVISYSYWTLTLPAVTFAATGTFRAVTGAGMATLPRFRRRSEEAFAKTAFYFATSPVVEELSRISILGLRGEMFQDTHKNPASRSGVVGFEMTLKSARCRQVLAGKSGFERVARARDVGSKMSFIFFDSL